MTDKIKTQPKKKRKKKSKIYFGQPTQDAIIEYNSLDPKKESEERSKIYGERIHPAFDKLSENIINTFKFMYFDDGFDDVKHEVVAFMVLNLHKYDHTKGTKAFSYFSVVAKNYLILQNNNNYKKYKSHDKIDDIENSHSNTKKSDVHLYSTLSEKNITESNDEFFSQLILYFDKNITNIFKRKRDIDIAFSILELMKQKDEIENFNKKALYILVREMTGVNTSKITKIVNVMKSHYNKLNKLYLRYGYINVDNKPFF